MNHDGIRLFHEQAPAVACSDEGDVALYLYEIQPKYAHLYPKAEGVLGRLFCNDTALLMGICHFLGCKKFDIHKRGMRGQHVDLIGNPLSLVRVCAGVTEKIIQRKEGATHGNTWTCEGA